MTRNLGSNAHPIHLQGSSTSYFSEVGDSLDPSLFSGLDLKGWVRNGLLQLLFDFLKEPFRHPELWAHVWLAGSGISYQWAAARSPGDLDVLIGVDYIGFRRAHPEFAGLSNIEISKLLNENFRERLQPLTEDWNGFEVTFYVNPGATDIRVLNPYAAYDLTNSEWTVVPSKEGAPHNPLWEEMAKRDASMTSDLITRYTDAVTKIQASTNPAARRNAEVALQSSLIQASAMFSDIHHARRFAFSTSGKGYGDAYNYRWQAGKKYGTVPALKQMSEYWSAYKAHEADETYGIELPDTQTLIRRAAIYRAHG